MIASLELSEDEIVATGEQVDRQARSILPFLWAALQSGQLKAEE